MNRQIRRDQERKQEKQDKEKEKRRSERRKRREQAKADRRKRMERKSEGDGSGSGEPPKRSGGRMPGRFSGALAAATVFFILLQGIVPTEDAGLLNTFVSAGFYLLFGYFATLWLLRRQTSRAVAFTIVAGTMLGLGVELGKYLRPELVFDPLLAVMIVPALIIGTLLGRLVFFNAPG